MMPRSLLGLAASFVALVGCASAGPGPTPAAPAEKPTVSQSPFPKALERTNACFALYDLGAGKMVEVLNEERCRQRHVACSTFKIPLAVMAFDTGILKDEKTSLKWDGKKRMLDAWNKDQTATSWMRESVVWYSQRLTPKLGRERIQSYLNKFDYGNEDFSGGLEDAWLTPAPFLKDPPKPSVMISALEQIEFMKKLYRDELPASKRAMALTKKILGSETSPNGAVLTGKTGSGLIGENANLRLGWFVAHLQKGDKSYLAVVTYDDLVPDPKATFGGALARESMKELLAKHGLW